MVGAGDGIGAAAFAHLVVAEDSAAVVYFHDCNLAASEVSKHQIGGAGRQVLEDDIPSLSDASGTFHHHSVEDAVGNAVNGLM